MIRPILIPLFLSNLQFLPLFLNENLRCTEGFAKAICSCQVKCCIHSNEPGLSIIQPELGSIEVRLSTIQLELSSI